MLKMKKVGILGDKLARLGCSNPSLEKKLNLFRERLEVFVFRLKGE